MSVSKKKFEATLNPTRPNGDDQASEHRLCYRLRRRIRFTSRKATRAVSDVHQKLSSRLAANYKQVLLLSFRTSEKVRRYFLEAAAGATPETAAIHKRQIRRPTARAMLAQARFNFRSILKFNMLLKYKLERAGGRLVECEEEYTSKTCSGCGAIKNNLGGSEVFRCRSCLAVFDRDVNAARNIFHKNMGLLL
ncbi:Transposase [Phytophthora megakarya]|uniref:Transposase n=1 Tax=Phytophthora megakarya TaxID=4795 RepID=A0A225WU15_9STRA|nr:Transposase [Phytophthora megakarya]